MTPGGAVSHDSGVVSHYSVAVYEAVSHQDGAVLHHSGAVYEAV